MQFYMGGEVSSWKQADTEVKGRRKGVGHPLTKQNAGFGPVLYGQDCGATDICCI